MRQSFDRFPRIVLVDSCGRIYFISHVGVLGKYPVPNLIRIFLKDDDVRTRLGLEQVCELCCVLHLGFVRKVNPNGPVDVIFQPGDHLVGHTASCVPGVVSDLAAFRPRSDRRVVRLNPVHEPNRIERVGTASDIGK